MTVSYTPGLPVLVRVIQRVHFSIDTKLGAVDRYPRQNNISKIFLKFIIVYVFAWHVWDG